MFLFADIAFQTSINIHANFQSFDLAFLLLFRCSTGETWDLVMADCMRQANILFQCSNADFDYATYAANGYQTNGCGSQAGIVFFMTFYLMVPLIFLNLFIAIILEGFEYTSKRANTEVSEE